MEILDSPMLIYFAFVAVFLIVSLGAFITAVILNGFASLGSTSIGIYGYTVSVGLFQNAFGLFDKSFPFILIAVMMLSAYSAWKDPDPELGIANLVLFFVTAFLTSQLAPAISSLSAALETSQLLPIETAFFTSPYLAYPLLAFTAVCAILNFRPHSNPELMDIRNRMDAGVHEHYEADRDNI